MYCPFCKAEDTRVIDSRLVAEGDSIRRRRECSSCKERFTTYETIELNMPRVIKSDGTRTNFNENKLRGGLCKSLEKRPVKSEDIERALHRIKHKLMAQGEREIKTIQIGEWVMDELRKLDQVAYVRFASVYRSFQDVQDFREEVDRLENQPSPESRKHQIPLIPEE